ncbi:MAG: DNA-protecting protein DprA [Anaerolineae bacterium]|nr:MAG: DNA-protecting protein DprA [Anaerolineae bacterium]
MTQDSTFVAWVGLCLMPRVGGKLMARLLNHFQTPENVLAAFPDDLRTVPGIGSRTVESIQNVNLEEVNAKIEQWQTAGIEILPHYVADYPPMLKATHDALPLLFKRGNWSNATPQTIAIVGTREPSPAAHDFAYLLGEKLSEVGWTIVSGMAVGIDTQAHHGALKTGATVAVLGCGLHNLYPPENKSLASQIAQQGALFSEVAPEVSPSSSQLVARNRIISGLSQAIILVESEVDGGAMHTVRFARDHGRPVFGVDFAASGNQYLKTEGAGMITPTPSGIKSFLALF